MWGPRGFLSVWPGHGATQGSPATSWLHFCRVQGKAGAMWIDTLSVGCPRPCQEPPLTLGGSGKALLHEDQTRD